MAIKTVHAIIKGKVQGVYFRAFTQDEAIKLALDGWVRNRPDGSVETLFSGEESRVDCMVSWLYQGSPASHVTEVLLETRQTETPLPRGFEILTK